MNSYEESLEQLRHVLSCRLYHPKTVGSPTYCTRKGNGNDSCKYRHHLLKHVEESYGQALMLFSICKDCGYGIGELFPPKQKKVILTH